MITAIFRRLNISDFYGISWNFKPENAEQGIWVEAWQSLGNKMVYGPSEDISDCATKWCIGPVKTQISLGNKMVYGPSESSDQPGQQNGLWAQWRLISAWATKWSMGPVKIPSAWATKWSMGPVKTQLAQPGQQNGLWSQWRLRSAWATKWSMAQWRLRSAWATKLSIGPVKTQISLGNKIVYRPSKDSDQPGQQNCL